MLQMFWDMEQISFQGVRIVWFSWTDAIHIHRAGLALLVSHLVQMGLSVQLLIIKPSDEILVPLSEWIQE
jgi:hypothetical protein